MIVQPVVEPMDRFTALTRTEASYHRRVALIMAVITVAFLVCWWPYAVIFMLGDRVPRIDTTNISRCIHNICLLALAPFPARYNHLGTISEIFENICREKKGLILWNVVALAYFNRQDILKNVETTARSAQREPPQTCA